MSFLKKRKMKYKIILVLITINIILISISGMEKGRMAFLTIPLVLLINIVSTLYGFIKQNNKLGVTALVLFFVAPIIIFIIFINVFPFLTR
ncbi:hypothetical protein BMS3Abin04_02511 [bacterium BMS3Abin04]|nr:hypothetical protein BMS3Abin04_02511 [bacterium BMS3Abin04]